MAREKKEVVEDEDPGAPEWMVTFSDCMTLLLTFFVLLLSFSSFSDVAEYRKMTVSFANRFASLSTSRADRSAMLAAHIVQAPTEELEEGSESKSALDGKGKEGGQKSTKQPSFHEKKIFIIDSEKVFWGRGVVLSDEGRAVLSDLAEFLGEVPNRVVVSECDIKGAPTGDQVGLQRAWSVIDFLRRNDVPIERLNLTSASTIMDEGETPSEKKRMLQIVLLERNL